MIEKFRKWMFNFSCLYVLVLFANAVIAQTPNEYSVEKNWSAKGVKSLKINPYDVRTRILPSEDNTVKVKLIFEALSDKEGEIDKLKLFLDNILIKSKEDVLNITNHGSKKATFINDITKEKVKLVFDNGRIKLRTLDWKLMEVYVPDNMDIAIHSYFSKVSLDFPLKGDFQINAFEAEVRAEKYKGNLTIEDGQFSKFYFGNLKQVDIKINDSDFTAESIHEWIMDSRFSDIKIGQCNELNYTGFEDKLEIEKAEKLQIKCNFSDININSVEKISGELFEGSLQMGYCDDAVLIGKHTEVEIQNIRIFKIRNCYDSDFDIDTLGRLYSLNGEFNEYNMGFVKKTFSIQTSQGEANLSAVAEDFEYIYLGGKFLKAEIHLKNSSTYRLESEVQFGEIELNKLDYKVELYDKKLNDEKFIYHYGSDSKKSNILINGYQMEVKLTHD